MARMIVPQEDEQELGLAQSQTVEIQRARQRQRDTVQSVVSSVILIGLLVGVLALITIFSLRTESTPIVTYQAPIPEEERVERPRLRLLVRANDEFIVGRDFQLHRKRDAERAGRYSPVGGGNKVF